MGSDEASPDNLRVPEVRGFKMVSLNIASLPLHVDEFRFWLSSQDFDLIAFNESRLDSSICDSKIRLNML